MAVPRFLCDVHLGRLARWLRLLGFDTLYRRDLEDGEIVRTARKEGRIVLTRDGGILADGRINSFRPASTDPDEQIVELLRVFSLEGRIRPFTRCLECNTPLRQAAAEAVRDLVPPGVFTVTDEFCRCPTCGRVYWPGSHYEGMKGRIGRWLSTCRGEAPSPP
ncbi:MAG TPA: Mut7-C RNAse domain-containing protein [Syntrophales bacterium]|nr:Mut7-C RNAse domain-containing protein [Syntrophales bacterium]